MCRKDICLLVLVGVFFLGKNSLQPQINIHTNSGPQFPTRQLTASLAESSPGKATFATTAVLFGFKEVASDILFLQIIQQYGDWKLKPEEKFKSIYPLIQVVSFMSPHFVPLYSFGALVLKELGYVDEAIDLLNKGIAENPRAFELWLYRDFIIRLFKTKEYKKAIEGIQAALQMEGHPPILQRILAYAYEKDGQIEEAILQWQKVYYSTKDDGVKQICIRHIQRLTDED
ncbi:tetratricopeptide repeat protein [Candidatus Aerophobetes bacterium]|nr:tetratricopeptide repeat protein [Candidatus Aerophobetes bacterium]